jgi:hypothetical protein
VDTHRERREEGNENPRQDGVTSKEVTREAGEETPKERARTGE